MNWTNIPRALASVAIALLVGTSADAQVWNEVGDAPDAIPAHQSTVGSGPLTNIVGETEAGNLVDVYSIFITDPGSFYATTEETLFNQTGSASYDTRLFLFDLEGNPLLANDDIVGTPNWRSLITHPDDFPTTNGNGLGATAGDVVLTRGVYLLAVTGFRNEPTDATGAQLFSVTGSISTDNLELHGPNPAAGPFAAWTTPSSVEFGSYNVELGGAMFPVPEPSTLALAFVCVAGLGLAARRRLA